MKPYILALYGRAGTGKDTVGKALIEATNGETMSYMNPVYEIASIRNTIEGPTRKARVEWAVTELLMRVFGTPLTKTHPIMEELRDLTDSILYEKLDPNLSRDRTFLQAAADLLRDTKKDVFVEYMRSNVNKSLARQTQEWKTSQDLELPLCKCGELAWNVDCLHCGYSLNESLYESSDFAPRIVITDLRYPAEAEAVLAWGGEVIKLTCPEIARLHRLEKRDGGISKDQQEHSSETAVIEESMISLTLDTDLLSVDECVDQLATRGRGDKPAKDDTSQKLTQQLEDLLKQNPGLKDKVQAILDQEKADV